ncbi:MAG TPA: C69 family dipeptidase [Candidatus Binatia bacterium]|nr:C69 family dipeptidase [Candidatus Binatia bacterium]
MCDTQVVVGADAVWFAKNSDREPSEPQPVVRFPAAADSEPRLRVTYLEIGQVPERRAVILSKPAWCWGAEMGVNDAGVAIGNEAIFSRCVSREPALLGMDLVRLGLERATSAKQAIEVITGLLEQHGQGGPAGYLDKGFCYDNSFLVADPRQAWVLETAGRQWAARRVESSYAVSNALTLHGGNDLQSASLAAGADFARRFDTRLRPYFAGAHQRRELATQGLPAAAAAGFAQFAGLLRAHAHGDDDPRHGSNADLCMHAAGFVRRSQTTGSMIARLSAAGTVAVFTGTSAPCLSIFRPVAFDGTFQVLTDPADQVEALLWRRHEWLHRWALSDADFRHRVRRTREEIEPQLFALLAAAQPAAADLARADRLAAAWHKVLWESLRDMQPRRVPRFWLQLGRRDGIDITRRASAGH